MIFSNFEGRVASARNFPAKMMKKVVPGKNLSKFYLLKAKGELALSPSAL